MRKFPSKKLWHAWKLPPLVGEGHFWAMNPSPLLILAHLAFLPAGTCAPEAGGDPQAGAAGVLWGKWKGHEEATNCICRPHASLWASASSSVRQGGTVSKVPPCVSHRTWTCWAWRRTQGTGGREEPYVCIISGGRVECVALGFPSISPPLP